MNSENHSFSSVPHNQTGIKITGEVRDGELINLADGGTGILLSQNNGNLIILKINPVSTN